MDRHGQSRLIMLLACFLVFCAIRPTVAEGDTLLPRPLDLVGLHSYAEKSVAAGQTIHFRTSSTVPYRLSICRLGWQVDDPAGDEVLTTFPMAEPVCQPIYPGSYVHVEKGLPADEKLAGLTLECWVRPWRVGTWQTLISHHNYPTNCGFILSIAPDGQIRFYLGDGTQYDRQRSHGGSKLEPRRWHHVVGTWDGRTKALWVDGECVGHWPFDGPVEPGDSALLLGACGHDGPAVNLLDGDLAMPNIRGRALSPEEIDRRFQQKGLQPPQADQLLACWPLDEERGHRLADVSENQRHGRIVNQATWMIGGPGFRGDEVPRQGLYDPTDDETRGHGLRLASDDLYDCGWQVTQEYKIPEFARPGLYVGRMHHELDGQPRVYHVTFIVRKPPRRAPAPILVIASTNTWLAYNGTPFSITPSTLHNSWGTGGLTNSPGSPPAYCMYRNHRGGQPAYKVGVNVPWPNAGPYVMYGPVKVGYSHLMRAERFALVWLEQNGYDYDMVSDHDLQREPDQLSGYKTVLINGHSEYWSAEGREALDRYLCRGGNAVVLSGNTMFWRVSFNNDGTIMECRKFDTRRGGRPGCTVGELWHSQDGRRGSLTRECGMNAWEVIGLETLGCWGISEKAFTLYRVQEPDHFLFNQPEKVGLAKGETFGGAAGGKMPKAVGHEPDVRISTLWRITRQIPPGQTAPQELPGILTIADAVQKKMVAKDFFNNLVPLGDEPASEIIYWERPQGGRVFHTGSVGSGWGLSADPKFQTLLRNVLHHFNVTGKEE